MGNDKRILVYQQGLSNGVSGSCYIINICFTSDKQEKLTYLVDCGMFLGGDSSNNEDVGAKEENSLFNASFPIKDLSTIKGVFITHGHTDHIGRLPYLSKNGYTGPVYISRGTDAFITQALSDCQNIIGKQKYFPEEAKYSQYDVEDILSHRKILDFEYEKRKNFTYLKSYKGKRKKDVKEAKNVYTVYRKDKNEVKVHFFSNGHLLGSSSILLEINVYGNDGNVIDNVNLLYSGDYKENNEFFSCPEIPSVYFEKPITFVTESTYGKSLTNNNSSLYQITPEKTHANEETGEVFEENVIRCIAGGGSLLVPVIALERTEIVLYTLRRLQKYGTMIFVNPRDSRNETIMNVLECSHKLQKMSKEDRQRALEKMPVYFDFKYGRYKLSKDIPIYLSGNLASEYLNIYLNREDLGLDKNKTDNILPFNFNICKQNPLDLAETDEQKIILATPGMMNGGTSLALALKMVQNEKNWIHFTSYVATGIAREFINAERGKTLELQNGSEVPAKAIVVQTTEFSGHARPNELFDFIDKFKNLKSVIVTHGEPESKEAFAKYVKKQLQSEYEETPKVGISSRNVVFRISNEGIDKILPSKLDTYYPIKDSENSHKKGVTTINHQKSDPKNEKRNKKKKIAKTNKYKASNKSRKGHNGKS